MRRKSRSEERGRSVTDQNTAQRGRKREEEQQKSGEVAELGN